LETQFLSQLNKHETGSFNRSHAPVNSKTRIIEISGEVEQKSLIIRQGVGLILQRAGLTSLCDSYGGRARAIFASREEKRFEGTITDIVALRISLLILFLYANFYVS
jgi:hypothetical protein